MLLNARPLAILTAVVLLVVAIAPAHAYIDLGSGSYMLQMSLAGLLALAFSAKVFWQRVKARVVNVVSANHQDGARDRR